MADHFVSRPAESDQLESFFRRTSQSPRRLFFVVHGLGGIGKTQLCVDFARRHQKQFSAVFWLDGSSRDALRQGLVDASLRLPGRQTHPSRASYDLQEAIDGILQWLSLPDNIDWLLIFDNADRDWQGDSEDAQAYDIEGFLPPADHGNIIVTTRLSRMQKPMASLHLDRVDDQIAREMIEAQAGKQLQGQYAP